MRKRKHCIVFVLLFLLTVVSGCGSGEKETVKIIITEPDGNTISRSVYEELLEKKDVYRGQYYSEANTVWYYYREGIDFVRSTENPENKELPSEFFYTGQRMLSAEYLEKSELSAGKIPEGMCEIIMYGEDESLIGQELLMYFRKSGADSARYIGFNVKICGTQNKYQGQVFFSEDLCMQMSMETERDAGEVKTILYHAEEKGRLVHYVGDEPLFTQSKHEYTSGRADNLFVDESLTGSQIVFSEMDYAVPTVAGAFYDQCVLGYGNENTAEKADEFWAEAEAYAETLKKQLEEGKITENEYKDKVVSKFDSVFDTRKSDDLGQYVANIFVVYPEDELILFRDMQVVDRMSPCGHDTYMISRDMYNDIFTNQESHQIMLEVASGKAEKICEEIERMGLKADKREPATRAAIKKAE